MSQHLQFRDGPSDTYNFPVQDSPTVGRTTPQFSAGNSQGSPSSLSDTGYRYVVAGVKDCPPSHSNDAFGQDASQGDPESVTDKYVREPKPRDHNAYEAWFLETVSRRAVAHSRNGALYFSEGRRASITQRASRRFTGL